MLPIPVRVLVACLATMLSLVGASSAGAAELIYAVDDANRLVSFSSATPRSIVRTNLTGLASGERVVGIDVRPANKQLLALTSASRLYALDPATGAATPIGSAAFTPGRPARSSASTSIRRSIASDS